MRKITCIIALFSILKISAQVGIGTNLPQEEVHVAGATSTVRVEGLNAANNSLNNGVQGNSRVFVNNNDDYLKSDEASPSTFVQTGTGSGYQFIGEPALGGEGNSQFTLVNNAIVELNYAISWKLQKGGGGNKFIGDGSARIVQSYVALYKWTLGGVPVGLVTTDLDSQPVSFLGLSGQFHINNDENEGAEYFFNNGTDFVKLGPGIYRPLFAVQVVVSSTNGYGAIKFVIGGGQDEMQAIAHYYN